MTRRNSQRRARCMQRLGNVVHGKALQRHRRRNRVDREVRRIDLDQPLGRGKPKMPVVRAPGRRVAVGGRLPAAQPIRRAELHPMRTPAPLHPNTHPSAIAARDTVRGGEPEMADPVVQNCVDRRPVEVGRIEAVVRLGDKALPIPQVPPVILCADQQRAVIARQQSRHHIA